MRKRTVNHVADTIFWYVIYFLPVIAYLLFCFTEAGAGGEIVPLIDFWNTSGFILYADNPIFTALYDIFGDTGLVALFDTDELIIIVSWFASTYIVHLAVDFLLFIPKLAHKWMNSFTRSE